MKDIKIRVNDKGAITPFELCKSLEQIKAG